MDSNTAKFDLSGDRTADVHALMSYVLSALKEKGYNPINQLVGYFISGDPTYITSYNSARSLICRLERDEILEEVIRFYVRGHLDPQEKG